MLPNVSARMQVMPIKYSIHAQAKRGPGKVETLLVHLVLTKIL